MLGVLLVAKFIAATKVTMAHTAEMITQKRTFLVNTLELYRAKKPIVNETSLAFAPGLMIST